MGRRTGNAATMVIFLVVLGSVTLPVAHLETTDGDGNGDVLRLVPFLAIWNLCSIYRCVYLI